MTQRTRPSLADQGVARSAKGGLADPNAGWVSSTYFAEGLPFSLVHKVAGEYLVNADVSAQIIGLTQFAHLPWCLKFLWAPFVDRFGSTKRWMVGAQVALAGATLFLAAFAATFVPWAFAIGILVLAACAATNDIAVDGYYLRRLDERRQSSLSGLRIAAYRVALMVGAGGIVTLGGRLGFAVAFTAAAAGLALLALGHSLLLRKDTVEDGHKPVGSVAMDAAKSFFAQRGVAVVIVMLITYKAGDALMFAMNAKFLRTLGLDTATRGLINGTFGTLASIGGSVAGAALISRLGFRRTFLPVTIAQAAAILLYVELAVMKPSLPAITVVILAEQFIAGLGTAAFTVFLVRICNKDGKATQFAFVSSLMTVAMLFAGGGSGFLFDAVGSANFFLVAFLVSLPGVIASAFVLRRSAV